MSAPTTHPAPSLSRSFDARTRRIRMLAAITLLTAGTLAAPPAAFAAEPAPVECEDGVAVVVDFTDLGGDVELGCAPGTPANGRAALLAAGFTATDGSPGFICAIDEQPDPCPEVFDGSFWAYWYATPGGEWRSYTVGADTSEPQPGSVEGWRYNDGETPPGVDTAAVFAGENAEPE
ncbi:MAG TPA: hypothetical protein PK781_10840, partial [Terrimesophilobacter sp.]|nr:hypothetical protein [Terrimesophilobacter sp.]